MTPPGTEAIRGPDALFVIACPVCRGLVAATGDLGGRAACCPLCANLFEVPFPEAAPTPAAAAQPAEGKLAADRPAVADQADGLPATPPVAPLPVADASPTGRWPAEPPLHAESPAATPAVTAAGALPAAPLPEPPPAAASAVAESPTAPPSGEGSPGQAAPEELPAEPPPPAAVIEAFDVVLPGHEAAADTLEAAAALDVAPPATVAPADVELRDANAGGPPPSPTEMVFTEPVRTIRLGGAVVELRRLTPEERRSRRLRRNVMMIVICVSILVVIVLLFGMPSGRR